MIVEINKNDRIQIIQASDFTTYRGDEKKTYSAMDTQGNTYRGEFSTLQKGQRYNQFYITVVEKK